MSVSHVHLAGMENKYKCFISKREYLFFSGEQKQTGTSIDAPMSEEERSLRKMYAEPEMTQLREEQARQRQDMSILKSSVISQTYHPRSLTAPLEVPKPMAFATLKLQRVDALG